LQVERGCADKQDVLTADHAGTSKEMSGNTIYIYITFNNNILIEAMRYYHL
jgi:hypothetical protein